MQNIFNLEFHLQGFHFRQIILVFISLIWSSPIHAQFDIQTPIINSAAFAITDTIYMDPNGEDTNTGTFEFPVKTFTAAVQKLPYGTAGVNGGNAYGLIMLKPGHYQTSTGFHQRVNHWQNGNVYRNVSLEGIGHVTIGGSRDNFSTEHLLILSGDHIFIKNINLQYSSGIGILLGRSTNDPRHQNHILIENVKVDSVGSFSMLFRDIDTILVRNCSSRYAARPGYDTIASPCQWPSGIKFFNCLDATIHDCEIAYTRGEGLNFHNSQRGEAFRNLIHDNGLNVYNDNSSKLSIHHNLIFNTPDIGPTYWRNCPADTHPAWSGAGFLIANEGACGEGNLPVFENCVTKCILPDEAYPNVDSMYVFNNILQNISEAFGFWQGRTDIIGVNCIRNVFIFNNTIIGVLGMEGTSSKALVELFFPDFNILFGNGYSYMENVHISQNIFTYDTLEYSQVQPYRAVINNLHPGPMDINFHENVWVKSYAGMSDSDIVRNNLPGKTYLLLDSLSSILPCDEESGMGFFRAKKCIAER
ncbi:MAG: right-handed parallel beta-helix repeat-containing protein [Saprospiraceae bacterium]|nr:right-handed parallel beta-helix repeat-containing protein [Saprospiraceae bacterium]